MKCNVYLKLVLTGLLPLASIISNVSHAEVLPCEREPTARCLILEVIAQWPTIDANDPGRASLAAELAFEAPYFQVNAPANTAEIAAQHNVSHQLKQEESFLDTIQQQNLTLANEQLNQLASPLQDYLHTTAPALYLEALTLSLHDADAETFKKHYYETLLGLDTATRTQRMIDIARHEILGGQPIKGRQTLANTDIDEFSASEYYLPRRATELLATRSEQLFLHPGLTLSTCSSSNAIGGILQHHLQEEVYLTAATSDEFPDIRTRIELLLLLARLHHNSAQCALLEKWLTTQAVAMAASIPKHTASDLIQDLMLARAIRRYING